MRLRIREIEPKDVNNCAALVAGNREEQRRYGTQLDRLASAWRGVLPVLSMNSTLVEYTEGSMQMPVAVGVSVFVSDEFVRELKTFPSAWIGPTLTDRALSANSPLLSPEQIREANSHSGLNLAIWTGVTSEAHIDQMIHVELFHGFFDRHLGYQIKEIICQPLDVQQMQATFQAGLFWFSEECQYTDGRLRALGEFPHGPFLMGGDRDSANRAFGSWFSGLLLSYSPPRLYFHPAEQRLLLAALKGLTDEELAEALGTSLAVVKKTWRIIYERTECIWRDRMSDKADEEDSGKRGKEKKQHMLSYLREHMEELRPILLPS